MADLTPEQAAQIQAMMANVEEAHRAVVTSRTALSALIAGGKATCTDVRTYNLLAKAVYAYQASVAGIIRANGGAAPAIPPPLYVAWKGVSGEAAISVDCSQLRGAVGNGLGDYYVPPERVEWKQEATPADVQVVNQVVAAVGKVQVQPSNGRLGFAPLAAIPIILIGIVVIVIAAIVLKIVEALKDIPAKIETTKQVAIQAKQHQAVLDRRQACYADCANRGGDAIQCAKACDRLNPSFKPTLPSTGWGWLGTLAALGVLGLVGYGGYRFLRGRQYGGGGRALPGRSDLPVLDAEYSERAA